MFNNIKDFFKRIKNKLSSDKKLVSKLILVLVLGLILVE